MWKTFQGAAGNFANQATKLAFEVLDSGQPESLAKRGQQNVPHKPPDSNGSILSDRLSALKARYKTPASSGGSPPFPHEGTVDHPFDDPSDVITESNKVKIEDRNSLKSTEESSRQHRSETDEEIQRIKRQHQLELQSARQDVAAQFQETLKAKDEEISRLREGNTVEEADSELARLRQQVAELQQKQINDVFGIDREDSEMAQLQHDYEELMIRCRELEDKNSELTRANQSSGDSSARLETEISNLRTQLETEKSKSEEEINRLQRALEERDAIWQRELVSSQTEQQGLRKQVEAAKRETDRLTKAYDEAKRELKTEIDLRSSAQAHVKSLQKSMMEAEGGSVAIKEKLSEAQEEIKKLQDFYENKLEAEAASWRTKVEELEETISYFRNATDSANQRAREVEEERNSLRAEVDKLTVMGEAEIDVPKLMYELESAKEDLKLAESRNNILQNEIESLTQELDQLKLTSVGGGSNGLVTSPKSQTELQNIITERDSYKAQLKRLKQQMIQMEEDQEASLHWRIDAEVKLALENFKKKNSHVDPATQSQIASLTEALEESKRIISLKDQELQNLQIALGEMTYHGEAADKLRRDLRTAQDEIQSLKDQIFDCQATVAEAQAAKKAAEAAADEAQMEISNQRDRIRQLEVTMIAHKKELLEAAEKLRRFESEDGSMVDRRLVVQLLVTYLERKHQSDALDVMARMLGLTDEEKRRVRAASSSRGLVGGTLALVKGGLSVATLGLLDRGLNSQTGSQLAEEWVEFLTKESDQTEDPLKYLQKGETESEAFASFRRLEEDPRKAAVEQLSRASTPPSEIRRAQNLPKSPLPSFKEFMETQKGTNPESRL